MDIRFPLVCITNGSKLSWLMRAQELLRIENNIVGKWYREGITLGEYQKLRASVQQRWSYSEGNLLENDWLRYKEDRFDVISGVISGKICELKNTCRLSTTYQPNLDSDIV